MEFYIYITNNCNLNCSYCSVLLNKDKAVKPQAIQYPLSDLRKFVDTVQRNNNDKHATICFFGGEPTLDFCKIESLLKAFENVKSYEIRYILHTNGLLLSSIPDTIIKRLDIIFLSLNYEKIFIKGNISDYFIGITESLLSIKTKKQIPTIGRLTITSETSLYSQCTLLPDTFDYIYWQIDNQEQIKDIVNYKENYKKNISILFDYWLSFLKKGTVLNYVPFLSIIRNLIDNEPPPKNYYCGYGHYSVFVQTDGACYACCEAVESSAHIIGDIYNGIRFSNMDIDNSKCLNCLYLKLCGGRCGRMQKDFSQKRINDFCELNIFTFNLIINALPSIKKHIKTNSDLLEAIYDEHLDYTEQIS